MHRDVIIVGGGPAGLALAHSLNSRGVDVFVVAPRATWHATYGAWRDDVELCELGSSLESLLRGAWSTVRVVGKRTHLLPRPYVVFDNGRLQASLGSGLEVLEDVVLSVEHNLEGMSVHLRSGETLTAELVIDATGNGEFLAQRSGAVGAQTAYGVVLDARDADITRRFGVSPDIFTLMDWSSPPTFLYSAQFLDGSVLLEETSLYATPPHDIDELGTRLAHRLGTDTFQQATKIERVTIPMGAPLPARTTRVVGFGAAVGYVHPVTGYSVAASLRAAPRVAEVIAEQFSQAPHERDLTRVVWDAVWPARFVRTRAWHDMGLQVLRDLPSESIGAFFDSFFSLPQEQWSAYLRIDSEPKLVHSAMLGVFRGVDTVTRLRLMSSPGALLRALVAR